MMLNINLDYDWIMGEGANYKTSIILNGRKQICHSHLRRRFSFPARTKRLLRRLRPAKSHNFLCFLTISQLSPQILRFSANSLLKPQVIANTRGKKKYAIISCVTFISMFTFFSHAQLKTTHIKTHKL